MLEIKSEEGEISKDNNNLTDIKEENKGEEQTDAPPEITATEAAETATTAVATEGKTTSAQEMELDSGHTHQSEGNDSVVLNPLNEPVEPQTDTESKGKQRRYWTPKEEERFFLIWGRENWRLTRHGKNTIFFAQWSEELKERYNIDVKPEEVQCKVNQTRAKFRSVKKLIESGSNCQRWKKYDLVEKILKNQYRSKDDEPVPLDALENNRDMSPTELLNCETRTSSPNGAGGGGTTDPDINLSQTSADPQLADEVNMSNISLSDQNLASHVFSNNSHSNTSFSTELFGGDQLDMKIEIENECIQEGYSEFLGENDHSSTIVDNAINNTSVPNTSATTVAVDQQQQKIFNQQQQGSVMGQQNLLDVSNNTELQKQQQKQQLQLPTGAINSNNNNNNFGGTTTTITNNINTSNNNIPLSNQTSLMGIQNNFETLNQNHTVTVANHNFNNNNNNNNHVMASSGVMQPPKNTMHLTPTPSPRKRSAPAMKSQSSYNVLTQDALENLYLEEVRKKNVILVEQGEINRKRLRLEEKKVKLMEDFFPKYLTLQQEILHKLENVTGAAKEAPIDIKHED